MPDINAFELNKIFVSRLLFHKQMITLGAFRDLAAVYFNFQASFPFRITEYHNLLFLFKLNA